MSPHLAILKSFPEREKAKKKIEKSMKIKSLKAKEIEMGNILIKCNQNIEMGKSHRTI